MRRSRGLGLAVAAIAATSTLAVGTPIAAAAPAGDRGEYTVLLEEGADHTAAVSAITAAGGQVVRDDTAVGAIIVTAPSSGFVETVTASNAVLGATHARPIGHAPADRARRIDRNAIANEHRGGQHGTGGAPKPAVGLDPLDAKLWGLALIKADKARAIQPGDRRVQVGILDTGVDGTHPDIAPNFDRALSRNFVTDIPNDPNGVVVDGPCEYASCVDPVDHDDDGHGTHVAGTIAAAANGFGISGVAPNVTLVNIRGGQDSGFFFLQPVVDALVYSGDAGLDVVNMSFYVDPWLYNCRANPADSPEAQIEQRTIIEAMNRALRYANRRGVTLVAALGNEHDDTGAPRTDLTSPDYPFNQEYPRPIDNSSCVDLPLEGPNVIGVSAVGPSGFKADYSNYGTEQNSLAAPGGYFRDGFGTPTFRTNENLILSTYPRNVGEVNGDIDPATGEITPAGADAGVQRFCAGPTCGYYQYLQGTSMASPHVAGVAALVVSQYGVRDPRHPGHRYLPPAVVERILLRSATDTPCPAPVLSYVNVGRSTEFDAPCVGTAQFNSIYGEGIVNALAAVGRR